MSSQRKDSSFQYFTSQDLVDIPDQEKKFEELLCEIDKKERFTTTLPPPPPPPPLQRSTKENEEPDNGGIPPHPPIIGCSPPPPGFGGFPPPPPPPFISGPPPPPNIITGGPPPPPLLAGHISNNFNKRNLPKLPQRIPKERMKVFHWEKINKPMNTIWIQNKLAEKTKEIHIDTKDIETLFQHTKRIRGDPKRHIPKKRETVSLISPKRHQILSIFISRIRLKNEDFVTHMLNMNDEKFTSVHLKTIQSCKAFPFLEEFSVYEDYSGSIDLLEMPDLYLRTIIMNLPRFQQRVSTWLFKKETFKETFTRTDHFLDILSDSCRSVLRSKNFHRFLQVVLAIGNFINGKNKRKVAHGFKIRSLKKLSRHRANKRSADDESKQKKKELDPYPISSLLDYVIGFVKEKYPTVEGFLDDLEPLRRLFSMIRIRNENDEHHHHHYSKLEDVQDDVMTLESELNKIEEEIEIRKKMIGGGDDIFLEDNSSFSSSSYSALSGRSYKPEEDQYISVMTKFLKEECLGRMTELRSKYQEVSERMESVRVMFGEERMTFSFFEEIAGFIEEYQRHSDKREKWRFRKNKKKKRIIGTTTTSKDEFITTSDDVSRLDVKGSNQNGISSNTAEEEEEENEEEMCVEEMKKLILVQKRLLKERDEKINKLTENVQKLQKNM